MDRETVLNMFSGNINPVEVACWLRNHYFVEIINRLNSTDSRRRFALYQGETIPDNERNLTDVRTRMGILIEFELARISNCLLDEYNINNLFWSYVVANRFPDLEIRGNQGERFLRFEVKCLQCVAEEKSANFDTLIKDISPRTDFVVVCLWDWESDDNNAWNAAPHIYKIYVMNAYCLAKLRDTYWLNRPPVDLGNGYQGFDIRFAVTCKNSEYSKEQGNYGKLMRIWDEDFEFRPTDNELLSDTEQEYLRFKKEILMLGFKVIAHNHILEITGEAPRSVSEGQNLIGYKNSYLGYFFKSQIQSPNHRHILRIAQQNEISIIVSLTEKYKCSGYRVVETALEQLFSDEKPKNVIHILRNHDDD